MQRRTAVASALLVLPLAVACGDASNGRDQALGAETPPVASPSATVSGLTNGGVCNGADSQARNEYVGLSRAEADSLASSASWSEVRRFGTPETQGHSAATNSNSTRLTLVFGETMKVVAACAG